MNLRSPLFLMDNYETFANRNENFFTLDNQELYDYHLKELGPSWKYAKETIVYKTNSLSYRTKELDYFEGKDFILILGSSHTFGTGLNEADLYHSHIGAKTGLEILNAGYGAIGPDMIMLNALLFLKNTNLKPKAVVIQWPELHRVTFKGNNEFISILPQMFITNNSHLSNIISDLEFNESSKLLKFYRAWTDDRNDLNHSAIFIEVTRLIWKLYGVPYFDFTLIPPSDVPNNIKLTNFYHLVRDLARDQVHYGSETHKAIGLEIYEDLKNNLVV